LPRVEGVRADVPVNRRADRLPALGRAGKALLAHHREGAVEGDPAHHFRVRVMARLPARLPDAAIGTVPARLELADEGADERPAGLADLEAALQALIEAVDHLAVDVELELAGGGVADPHGPGILVAGEPIDGPLRQAALAGDAVHDLHVLGIAGHG